MAVLDQQHPSLKEKLSSRAAHLQALLKLVDTKANPPVTSKPHLLFIKAVNAEITYIEWKLKKT